MLDFSLNVSISELGIYLGSLIGVWHLANRHERQAPPEAPASDAVKKLTACVLANLNSASLVTQERYVSNEIYPFMKCILERAPEYVKKNSLSSEMMTPVLGESRRWELSDIPSLASYEKIHELLIGYAYEHHQSTSKVSAAFYIAQFFQWIPEVYIKGGVISNSIKITLGHHEVTGFENGRKIVIEDAELFVLLSDVKGKTIPILMVAYSVGQNVYHKLVYKNEFTSVTLR